MDRIDLIELLDRTQTQLNTIRRAIAASDHASTMFAIDCLVGAAAEQTTCKLASLKHGGLPMGTDVESFEGPAVRSGKAAPSGKPAAGRNRF